MDSANQKALKLLRSIHKIQTEFSLFRKVAVPNALVLFACFIILFTLGLNPVENAGEFGLITGLLIALTGMLNWIAGFITLLISLAKPGSGILSSSWMLFSYVAMAAGFLLIWLNADSLPA